MRTELDPGVALIVIDLQELIRGLPYSHPIDEVLRNAGRLAAGFRQRSLLVVTTVVSHGTMTRADRRMQLPADIPTEKLELVTELDASPSDIRLPKSHWGAFTDTDLEARLRDAGVTNVVICGVATGYGVESTARAASELGFNVTIAQDAMSDMSAAVHQRALENIFPALAQCRTTDSILETLLA